MDRKKAFKYRHFKYSLQRSSVLYKEGQKQSGFVTMTVGETYKEENRKL